MRDDCIGSPDEGVQNRLGDEQLNSRGYLSGVGTLYCRALPPIAGLPRGLLA